MPNPNNYKVADIVCPFYKSYTKQSIRCEGYNDGTCETTTFDTVKFKNEYMDQFCCGNYRYCYKAVQLFYAKDGQ